MALPAFISKKRNIILIAVTVLITMIVGVVFLPTLNNNNNNNNNNIYNNEHTLQTVTCAWLEYVIDIDTKTIEYDNETESYLVCELNNSSLLETAINSNDDQVSKVFWEEHLELSNKMSNIILKAARQVDLNANITYCIIDQKTEKVLLKNYNGEVIYDIAKNNNI